MTIALKSHGNGHSSLTIGSLEGCRHLSRLGSGEKNLSRQGGTKVASRPSERGRASQLAGHNMPGHGPLSISRPGGALESFPLAALLSLKIGQDVLPPPKLQKLSLIKVNKALSRNFFSMLLHALSRRIPKLPLIRRLNTGSKREFRLLNKCDFLALRKPTQLHATLRNTPSLPTKFTSFSTILRYPKVSLCILKYPILTPSFFPSGGIRIVAVTQSPVKPFQPVPKCSKPFQPFFRKKRLFIFSKSRLCAFSLFASLRSKSVFHLVHLWLKISQKIRGFRPISYRRRPNFAVRTAATMVGGLVMVVVLPMARECYPPIRETAQHPLVKPRQVIAS